MFSPVALYVIGIMSGAVSAAVLGSLWNSRIPGLFRWIGAHSLIVVSMFVLALNSTSPPPLTVVVGSTLFVSAGFLVLQGYRLFFRLPAVRFYELAAYAVTVAALIYFSYVMPSINARIVATSTFLGYVRMAVGWTAYTHRPRHRPAYSYFFVTAVAALGGLVHLARSLSVVMGIENHTQFFDSSPMNIAFIAMGIVTLPCLAIGAVMLAYDRMAERMERIATIDELTSALTRREFMAQAELQLERAQRSQSRFAVAILDIDHFKGINDAYGHAAGDLALSYFASIVSQHIRKGDIFGRLGGEEFAILFPTTRRAEADALVNRLRARVATSTLAAPCGEISCTFSAGVDEYQMDDTVANLMARADAALYSAKAMGRNLVVSAIPTEDQAVGLLRKS
jgi:diguanylate cyclase (GGDEF)-like protein